MFETMRSSMFMPHGMCFMWQPEVLWLHAITDTVIAVSYYLIPLGLIYFVRRRRDLPFNWMFVMFGIFILGCGTTHVMAVWTLWYPNYWIDGFIKAGTALASVVTAVLLWWLMPQLLALPSPAQLREANENLSREVAVRRRAEFELQQARDDLEIRVQERTAELFELQNELAHVLRVTTMGEMAASIAHEVNQPLAAVITNADAGQRWLAADPPNLAEARSEFAADCARRRAGERNRQAHSRLREEGRATHRGGGGRERSGRRSVRARTGFQRPAPGRDPVRPRFAGCRRCRPIACNSSRSCSTSSSTPSTP